MKTMHKRHTLRAASAAALLLLGACGGKQREPKVEDVWVRLPAVKGEQGAAYFRLEGNIEGTRLTGITSPLIRRVELHETVEKNGVTRMEKRRDVEFPYRGALEFKPGGRHAMLFGIRPGLKPGDRVTLRFTFDKAPPVSAGAVVRGPGEGHSGH